MSNPDDQAPEAEEAEEAPAEDEAVEDEGDEERPEIPWHIPRGYVVDPNHVPRPTDRIGTLRTDENLGGRNVTHVAPIFGVAHRRSLLTAHRALDPEDEGVSSDHVHFAPARETPPPDFVRDRIDAALEEEADQITNADQMSVPTTRVGEAAMPIDLPGREEPPQEDQDASEEEPQTEETPRRRGRRRG